MHKIDKNRFGEWPIVRFWYTKKKGLTIEEVIDKDLDWFVWAVATFQNVTPKQAEHFFKRTGKKLNPRLIQDVEPYEWQVGDTEELYMELCDCQDLTKTLRKYRGEQLELF
jgi:hypothetical protein